MWGVFAKCRRSVFVYTRSTHRRERSVTPYFTEGVRSRHHSLTTGAGEAERLRKFSYPVL